MTAKTITIAGKEVAIAYCYATEIAFRKYTGVSLDQFDAQDPEHILYLIISAIVSHAQAKGRDVALDADELMYDASPKDIIAALTEVLNLRKEWYEIPEGEPEDGSAEKGESGKNV